MLLSSLMERSTSSLTDFDAMSRELFLTPDGRLQLSAAQAGELDTTAAWMKRVVSAFESCQASGLFTLAASKPDAPPSPSLSFWREFSSRYLSGLCKTPELSLDSNLSTVEPPSDEELQRLLSAVPPMRGAEYISSELLVVFWNDLNTWVREELRTSND
ncbi:MAG: hypothetical protein K2Z81_03640, partial [Cyanobacteria bacterium]|nr:hypothetical protein [Cyanobacteriota bacterium]